MSNEDFSPDEEPEVLTGDLTTAGVYPTMAQAREHGLVVLAMGLPYWLDVGEAEIRLFVGERNLAAVREQLDLFDRESINWPPAPVAAPDVGGRLRMATPLLWALSVLAVFQMQHASGPPWVDRGMVNAGALFIRGEWWRPMTALWLHHDVAHLSGNVVTGVFVFAEVVRALGVVRGWSWLLGAAVVGNVAAAALHLQGEYTSLGASTAVFAGLGLLTGRAAFFAWPDGRRGRLRAVIWPLAAGAALLALFGAGGARTDVVAHTTGFLAGVGSGLLAAFRKGRVSPRA